MSRYAKEYARAIFDLLLEEDKVDAVLNDLLVITTSIKNDQAFIHFLKHPKIASDEKKAFVDAVFTGIDSTLKHFLYVLLDNNRLHNMQEVYLSFMEIYKQYNQKLEVKALTSIPLSDEQVASLEEKLSKKYTKKVNVINEIDSHVIGGLRLIINNEVIDHSISSHLTSLKSFVLKQN